MNIDIEKLSNKFNESLIDLVVNDRSYIENLLRDQLNPQIFLEFAIERIKPSLEANIQRYLPEIIQSTLKAHVNSQINTILRNELGPKSAAYKAIQKEVKDITDSKEIKKILHKKALEAVKDIDIRIGY